MQTAGDKLSDAERQSRLRTIDEKEKTLQRNVEDARNDFSGEMNEKFSAIAQKVAGVMTRYAQENGYTLVLDAGSQQQQQASPILWAAESTNISEAIVQAYNKQSGVPPQPAAAGAQRPTGTTTRVPARTPTAPRATH
jgi:outer membrane protein